LSYKKSTNEIKKEVLTICGELTDGTSPFDSEVLKYLNNVHQGLIAGNNLFDISCMEPWVWAQAKSPITLKLTPAISGTVSLVNGSSSGTLSASPSANLEGRYVFFDGVLDAYRISYHSGVSTTISLDYVFLGDTGSFNFTAFKYDYDVLDDVIAVDNKNLISFNEGATELIATIPRGTYTPAALATAAALALQTAGTKTYTGSFDSTTRKFSFVQGGTSFSLTFGTGSYPDSSAASLLGFDQEDQSGALTYESAYALSGIARFSKPILVSQGALTNPKDSKKIFMIDDNSFDREYPIAMRPNAIPDKFCIIMQKQDGQTAIRVNGSVQDDLRIEVPYIPVPKKLCDNDNSYPLVPGSYSDFLVYAAAHFIQMDKSDSKATDSLNKAQAQLKALIAFNRQGSQIAGNNQGKLIPRAAGLSRRFGTRSVY